MPAVPRLLVVLAAAGVALASAAAAEEIRSFAADIRVAGDASLRVEEHIVYDFGGLQRHGIYRDIPVRYDRGWEADHALFLEVTEVTDEEGRGRRHRIERQGRTLRIRIGDPDRTLSGVQHYRIRYRVQGALLFLEEHEELYWNVTGNQWRVPIRRAEAVVRLPGAGAALDTRCFTGPLGSTRSECRVGPAVGATGGVVFEAQRALEAGAGLTVVVALPKGAVAEPGPLARLLDRLRRLGGAWLLTPFAALAGMLGLWRLRGRDPRVGQAIVVRYQPPAGLSPAEVGALLDERVDVDDVTSTILDLAVRGYLRIAEVEGKGFLFLSDRDYELERRRPADESLRQHEAVLLGRLFRDGDRVRVSSLKQRFHEDLDLLVSMIYRGLSGPGSHFVRSPRAVRRRWYGAGLLVAFGAAALATTAVPLGGAIAVAVSGGVVALFGRAMPRRTRQGRRVYEEILGFQEFLARVEADRLEREGRRTTETFETILPYAQVLGVADHWADVFADLYTRPPDWYVGSGAADFTPRGFVSDLGRAMDSMGRAVASRPQGSSGGSGLGAGGFSGGGFGGGGGGSW